MASFIKNSRFILILILFFGFIIRLSNIAQEPFWGDEIYTLGLTKYFQGNFSLLLDYLQTVFIYPPLYLWLQKIWVGLFGYNELAVRLLSVFFGLGVIWAVYYFVKKITYRPELALLSAFFVSISPMQIEFSQEARSYIMVAFFGIISVFSYWLYENEKNRKWLILFVLSSVLGFYSHYSFLILLLAITSWWLIIIFNNKIKAKELINFLLVITIIFILVFPWLETLIFQSILIKNNSFLSLSSGVGNFRDSYALESIANNLIWTSNEIRINSVEVLAAGIFKFLLLFLIIFIFIGRPEKLKDGEYKPVNSQFLVYLLYIFFVSILLFIIFPQSNNYIPIYQKHIITSSVIGVILIAHIIYYFNKKLRLLLIVLFIVSLVGFNIRIMGDDSDWSYYYDDKSTAQYINNLYQPGDLVIVYASYSRSIMNYYLLPEITAIGFSPLLIGENDWLSSRYALGFLENQSQFRDRKLTAKEENIKIRYLMENKDPRRVWLLDFPEDSTALDYFTNNNWRLSIRPIGRIFDVYLFAKPGN